MADKDRYAEATAAEEVIPFRVIPFPLEYQKLGGVEIIVPPGVTPDPTVTACGTALVDSATCPNQAPCPGLA
jgi:hypothetical protein